MGIGGRESRKIPLSLKPESPLEARRQRQLLESSAAHLETQGLLYDLYMECKEFLPTFHRQTQEIDAISPLEREDCRKSLYRS
jgi:hypothetical protein